MGKANDLLLQEQEKKSGNPLNADDDNNPVTDSGILKVLEVCTFVVAVVSVSLSNTNNRISFSVNDFFTNRNIINNMYFKYHMVL